MQTLLLLRHAKSSWDDPALDDHERPLAPRGRRASGRICAHMRSTRLEPEVVLCSTARRARETLELVRPAFPSSVVSIEDELYAASADELLTRIRRVGDSVASVLVIGHNPGLQQLALLLASGGDGLEQLEAKFPTAALATLTLDATWSRLAPGGASLAAYVVPRQLG
ncbi:MAG: SixA phosphatase family protein [Gaiellaceae bacterium]